MESTKSVKSPSALIKGYLFFYNAIQVAGWSFILYKWIYNYYLDNMPSVHTNIWEETELAVIVFQNAAFLEIIHAACGIVKSNPVITTFQVLSRMMVVIGVLMATPIAQSSPGVPLALFAWSVTEIIRYSYYAFHIINFVPYVLVYLRYTTFIVLYPIGVIGELLCFLSAEIEAYSHPNYLSIRMPNVYNVTFSYFALLTTVVLLYIPLFPRMYRHMFVQRRKILGGSSSSKPSKNN